MTAPSNAQTGLMVTSKVIICQFDAIGTVRLKSGAIAHGRLGSTEWQGRQWLVVMTPATRIMPSASAHLLPMDEVAEIEPTPESVMLERAEADDASAAAQSAPAWPTERPQ